MSGIDLRELRAPDETAAQERAWPAVREAFATRERVARRAPWGRVALAAAALALVVGALTPPGQALGGYLRDRIVRDTPREAAPPALVTGTPGRLLLTTPAGVWVVRGDGSGRLLGRYAAGTWSPNGLFVGVTRDRTLAAVEPDTGTVRWRLDTRAPVSDVRWSPRDGFRIAYREGRGELRIVNGDGTGDRVLTTHVGVAAPAWRPDSHVLAYDDGAGHIVEGDVDGAESRVVSAPPGLTRLDYAPDGTLLALASGDLRAVDPDDGSSPVLLAAPVRALAVTAAAPGEVVALQADGTVHRLGTDGGGDRVVATIPGATDVAWSPDGRTLLVAEPAGDRWHLLDARTGAARTVEGVAARLDPDGLGAAAFPALAGWCC